MVRKIAEMTPAVAPTRELLSRSNEAPDAQLSYTPRTQAYGHSHHQVRMLPRGWRLSLPFQDSTTQRETGLPGPQIRVAVASNGPFYVFSFGRRRIGQDCGCPSKHDAVAAM